MVKPLSAFTNGTTTVNDTCGKSGIDFNYGVAPRLQFTATLPVQYDFPAVGAAVFGPGNVEPAAKYRFLTQQSFGLDVALTYRLNWYASVLFTF